MNGYEPAALVQALMDEVSKETGRGRGPRPVAGPDASRPSATCIPRSHSKILVPAMNSQLSPLPDPGGGGITKYTLVLHDTYLYMLLDKYYLSYLKYNT